MPYISREARQRLADDSAVAQVRAAAINARNVGELNFLFCVMVQEFLLNKSKSPNNPNYAERSAALAVLRDAEHECRRRLLDPYEDGARNANGDIFG